MAKKKPTKAESQHMDRVAALGCHLCFMPAQVHHITGAGMGLRSSHYETIPLCPRHHTDGGWGIAVHAGVETWERKFGSQRDMLTETLNRLGAIYGKED